MSAIRIKPIQCWIAHNPWPIFELWNPSLLQINHQSINETNEYSTGGYDCKLSVKLNFEQVLRISIIIRSHERTWKGFDSTLALLKPAIIYLLCNHSYYSIVFVTSMGNSHRIWRTYLKHWSEFTLSKWLLDFEVNERVNLCLHLCFRRL